MSLKSGNLLKKYDIPINHLDFDYIRNCKNGREMEKIVSILRSGEEGYFPDLTKCAEDRLKELKPGSKVLRTEVPVLSKYTLTYDEWGEINDPLIEWTTEIKFKDEDLIKSTNNTKEFAKNLPPIRKNIIESPIIIRQNINNRKVEREPIKSTDYQNWDKYDAETEELKIDLEEEIVREEVERKNRINSEKIINSNEIETITLEDVNKMLPIEKEILATRYKERGNDYFRAKEYSLASKEYTTSIQILPFAATYNNRALARLKSSKYSECINDCEKCLEKDPNNLKALLRKGEALLALDKKHNALQVYEKICDIDSKNTIALTHLKNLKNLLATIPPTSATRINIEETNETQSSKNDTMTGPYKKKQEDLSKLIIPHKIVKSNLTKAVEALGANIGKGKNIKNINSKQPTKSEMKLFPDVNTKPKKKIIEEI